MATRRDPRFKECRRFGVNVYGHPKALKRVRKDQRQKKMSEYGTQLLEKQKLRAYYNLLERQFVRYYDKAKKMQGVTGENLLSLLERRIDNVVFRLGLANTRRQARQIVRHGHILVNGKRLNIPSALVYANDVVSIAEKSRSNGFFKELAENYKALAVPGWLSVDRDHLTGTVLRTPSREDIDVPVNEQAIVELYSK